MHVCTADYDICYGAVLSEAVLRFEYVCIQY